MSIIYFKALYAIGSVPSLTGHATAYRLRLLPKVRRHRASKPHGCSERVLPWQVFMDQLICASLSHTHYWYEVGMLVVQAIYTGIVQLTLSRVIVEMVADGGGHFSPASYRWFTRMSLLLSAHIAHNRAVGTPHTITNTERHT